MQLVFNNLRIQSYFEGPWIAEFQCTNKISNNVIYKNPHIFQTHRGGVHLELTRQKKSTTSKLTVHDFRHEDAGTYECRVEDDSSNELKDTLLSPSFKDSVSCKLKFEPLNKGFFRLCDF